MLAVDIKIRNKQLVREIGKHHRAEKQIHIRTKAMEAAMDAIFIIDVTSGNFPVIYSNKSFSTMTGYSRREIIGRNYFSLFENCVSRLILGEVKKAIEDGRSFYGETLHLRKNGEKYWNLLRISPVHDINGIITHYVGIKTDLTQLRQRDLEIKEQHEEILHITRVGKLSEFVSSLAHEISQPLTAINSYAEAAQRMLADREPKIREILQFIINDDQRAADVILHLRSLLKKDPSERKAVDMNVLINETVMLTASDLKRRNTAFKIELESGLPPVLGDRIQFQQVLLNLISNAFDAMDSSPNPHEMLIRTSCKDGGAIMVEVKDSGSGISAEDLPKLFKRFFTSKTDGLGMGLPISRSIIEAHDGRLDARNNPEGGATFYFTIPMGIK